MLAKLGIRPFSYGLVVQTVYENASVFDPEVLDLTEDDLIEKFAASISTMTALSLAISYPTIAAVPDAIINGCKNVVAVAIEIDYSFPLAEKVKEYLKVNWRRLFFFTCVFTAVAIPTFPFLLTPSL